MGKLNMRLNSQALLFEYICLKAKNNLGYSVEEEEFNEFTDQILKQINSSHETYQFYLDIVDFNELCLNMITNLEINGNREFTYDGKTLRATYNLASKKILDNMSAKKALKQYIEEQVTRQECKPKFQDYSYPSSEYSTTAKNIAAYLLHYLMRQYVDLNISSRKWPKQCWCPYVFALDKDLGRNINLPGTKDEFLTIYVYAQKVIGELLENKDYFEISSNPKKCLAFANFTEIVAPFKSMNFGIYNQKDFAKKNKTISIIVDNNNVILREHRYVSTGKDEGYFAYTDYPLPNSEPEYLETISNGFGTVLTGTKKTLVH